MAYNNYAVGYYLRKDIAVAIKISYRNNNRYTTPFENKAFNVIKKITCGFFGHYYHHLKMLKIKSFSFRQRTSTIFLQQD